MEEQNCCKRWHERDYEPSCVQGQLFYLPKKGVRGVVHPAHSTRRQMLPPVVTSREEAYTFHQRRGSTFSTSVSAGISLAILWISL